ncbi:NRDE family protein [Caldimonas thermodepolymerans]|uniref:NRDE family protein n=1 Tax=Caldimonas thermodepolymerans TaxID=215580 RepID=UPI002235D6F8|nr:NRDE family protein [Caldimonas thermodepolymerans]UZG42721.1 NRDE family protein [Caldimonas thermodepolymerans]
MCLAAVAIDASARFPFVVAANRDEYFDRAASALDWWTPAGGGPAILGGRDLHAGGTWLGLTQAGRVALLTNVRNPADIVRDAPSRGAIVPHWLRGDLSVEHFWRQVAQAGYNGFNVIAADLARGTCAWASNRAARPHPLRRGIHGLSNAQLDTPWPKVERLKRHLREALDAAASAEALALRLFAALGDATPVPDEHLPRTGVPLEWERWLAPAFIRTPDGRYGTRCSIVIVTERRGAQCVTHVIERSFPGPEAGPGDALERRHVLQDWPPVRDERLAAPAPWAEAHRPAG